MRAAASAAPAESARGRVVNEADDRTSSGIASAIRSRAAAIASKSACGRDDGHHRAARSGSRPSRRCRRTRRRAAAGTAARAGRRGRPCDRTVAAKSRRAMTKAERKRRIIGRLLVAPIAAAAVLAGDGDEGVVQAGPLDRQRLDSGAAVDQRLEQAARARPREARRPIHRLRVARVAGMAARHGPSLARVRSRTIGRSRSRASSTLPSNATLPVGDDRDALAQPLGMGDDVGREDDRDARRAPRARISSSSLPWLIASRPRRARRARSAAACGRWCRAAARSAPCPWTRCGSASSPSRRGRARSSSSSARRRPSRERQAAQRAHEGDRLARVHRRIEAALLGQVADLRRRLERPVAAEHAARAARRIDDPEQHPQRRRLARAVGAEQAVDGAGRHREADAVDRARVVEILDEIDRFDREPSSVGCAVEACRSTEIPTKIEPSGVEARRE